MTPKINAASMAMRRTGIAALVSVLLGVASFTVLFTGTASAATGTCDPGEFCMWWSFSYTGGLYEYAPGLAVLMTVFLFSLAGIPPLAGAWANEYVTNNTESVWNRGLSDPNGYIDVVVYDGTGTGYTGAGLCVVQGRKANLPTSWLNRISSYRWVTASTCSRYPRL